MKRGQKILYRSSTKLSSNDIYTFEEDRTASSTNGWKEVEMAASRDAPVRKRQKLQDVSHALADAAQSVDSKKPECPQDENIDHPQPPVTDEKRKTKVS